MFWKHGFSSLTNNKRLLRYFGSEIKEAVSHSSFGSNDFQVFHSIGFSSLTINKKLSRHLGAEAKEAASHKLRIPMHLFFQTKGFQALQTISGSWGFLDQKLKKLWVIYSCLPVSTRGHSCLLISIRVNLRLLVSTRIDPCLPQSTRVYPRKPASTRF